MNPAPPLRDSGLTWWSPRIVHEPDPRQLQLDLAAPGQGRDPDPEPRLTDALGRPQTRGSRCPASLQRQQPFIIPGGRRQAAPVGRYRAAQARSPSSRCAAQYQASAGSTPGGPNPNDAHLPQTAQRRVSRGGST
jgi:hypothetical protein